MQRSERYTPMIYENAALMKALSGWCICLKVWLHPDQCGEHLERLQKEYPKPDIVDIDLRHHLLHEALSKDSKPMIKYRDPD
jgi:hypothetical protein